MTKFSLVILKVLDDNHVDTASKAFRISQILEMIPENQRKSYSTAYRHLQSLAAQGYIQCGIADSLAGTYFIVETGKSFCKSNQ